MEKTPQNGNVSASDSRTRFVKAYLSIRRRNGIQLSQNSEVRRRNPSNPGKFRKGKVVVRCSPGMTSDLFASIHDEQQVNLIREMGFGGLQNINIHKTNKHFGAWVLSKYDPITSTIKWGKGNQLKQLKLRNKDANLLFGIPWEGKDIVPATQKELIAMKKYICAIFGKEKFEQISLPFLGSILYKKPNGHMSGDEVVRFKTAFILFIVTKFLAPVSLCNHISSRYMKALVDIENVQNYNWAKFVIDELKVAAENLQDKLSKGSDAGYINGCIPLLQLFYLDNLDNGINTPRHDCFPRIKSYNDLILADFIEKDMVIQNRLPFPSFGKLKLRRQHNVCYTARDNEEVVEKRSNIKTTPKLIHDIDPPSFDLGLSQLDDDNTLHELSPKYQIPGNLTDQFDEVAEPEVVPDTPPSRQGLSTTGTKNKPIIISPHSILKEVSGVRIEMRESYAGIQIPPKAKKKILGQPSDLLVELPARTIKPSLMVKSPFLSKQQKYVRNDNKALDDLFQYTINIRDNDSLKKIWVHLSNPVPMKLHLVNIQEALQIGKNMQGDTFNVAVHVLLEEELQTFGSTEFVGWRHFLTQDFAMYALANNGSWDPYDHLHFFTDDSLFPYSVLSCRLVFIPVHQVAHYSLYVYDLENKEVTILDPVRDISMPTNDIEQRHGKIKMQVSKALQECFLLAFPEWSDDIPDWELKLPTTNLPECSAADSGYHVLNYMRNWDGTRLVNPVTMEPVSMRKEFLMNLLSLRNNEAILPEVVQTIIKGASRR